MNSFFIFRRLHSLLGLYALTVFIWQELHAFTRVFVPTDIASVNEAFAVQAPGLNILTVYIPLLVYFLYGLGVWLGGRSNLLSIPTPQNFLYDLERVTGFASFFFAGAYLWIVRLQPVLAGHGMDYVGLAAWFGNPVVWLMVTGGFLITILHLSCLLRRFLFQWGLILQERPRRIVFLSSLLPVFLVTVLFGLSSARFVYHFVPAPRWLEALMTQTGRYFF